MAEFEQFCLWLDAAFAGLYAGLSTAGFALLCLALLIGIAAPIGLLLVTGGNALADWFMR